MPENTSTLTRRQLGRYLREAREAAKLTLSQAAKVMEWGTSTLQRIEVGETAKIRIHDLDKLISLYEVDDHWAVTLRAMAQQAAVKSWYHEFGSVIPEDFRLYVDMEYNARIVTSFQPDLVPGLLQTRPYARVLTSDAYPDDDEAKLGGRLELKARRQRAITRDVNPIQFNVILGETVLRRVIGGPKVMANQLEYLATASTRPNVSLRVLPFSAGMPTGRQTGPFVILEAKLDSRGDPAEPPTVYGEGFSTDMYTEKSDIVESYASAFRILQRAALDEMSSRQLVRNAVREYL
ncbi:helix-turn-helix domain-containing protein [Nocardia sp. NPDC059229]|uniref:helix-turn-helix domain-containing protein n=1 Tax=Nocardia sp. NPDC059229 TaxID=3346778 RepID=UPI0036B25DA8